MKLRRVAAMLFFLILTSTTAHAGLVDPALVGKWLIPMNNAKQDHTLLWRITATDESTMNVLITEAGGLVTDLESWTVQSSDSPPRLLTGTYRVTGLDTFATVMPKLSPEWITWTRVVQGNIPPGVEACVVSALLDTADLETPQSSFNPAFIGLWRASTMKEGSRIELVWRIFPNGHSTFVAITEPLTLPLEAYDGHFRIMSVDGREHEGEYRIFDGDSFTMFEGDFTTTTWVRCGVEDAGQR